MAELEAMKALVESLKVSNMKSNMMNVSQGSEKIKATQRDLYQEA
jgi:hypothetical protein